VHLVLPRDAAVPVEVYLDGKKVEGCIEARDDTWPGSWVVIADTHDADGNTLTSHVEYGYVEFRPVLTPVAPLPPIDAAPTPPRSKKPA
jgi:hypothetical protein